MQKIILDLCGGTGSWSKPYLDNGYTVVNATLPDWNVKNESDQERLIAMKPYGILAAPPCTMFSYARQNAKTPRDLREGMRTVQGCLDIIWRCQYDGELKFWALENPWGYLKLFLGKPALVFHPYEYGDPYTKRTCLWGLFNEPRKHPVSPIKIEPNPTNHSNNRDFTSSPEKFRHLKPIPEGYCERTGLGERTVIRSMTPQGFANAFYKANK